MAFAAELGRSSLSDSPDFWPTAVSLASSARRPASFFGSTSGRTEHLEFPVVVRAHGLGRASATHLLSDVTGRPGNARHFIGTWRSDHVHGTTRCFTHLITRYTATTDTSMLCTVARTPHSMEHVLVVSVHWILFIVEHDILSVFFLVFFW